MTEDADDAGSNDERARDLMVRRLRRIVADARKAGLVLATDADAVGVRVLTRREHEEASDLRKVGEIVTFDDGCGGGQRSGDSKYGNV